MCNGGIQPDIWYYLPIPLIVCILCVIGLVIFFWWCKDIEKRSDVMRRVLAVGNSMKPAYPIIGLYDLHEQDKYVVGDVVLFRNNGRSLFSVYGHRIIRINEQVFTAKGDNRKKSDRFEIDVPVENIIGKIGD